MKKVAIIGAKGFIGRHLSWYLKAYKGVDPELYDICDVGSEENYHKIDLLDKGTLSQMICLTKEHYLKSISTSTTFS